MKTKRKLRQYRQGDVFIEEIAQTRIDKSVQSNKLVLAEGEVTGHCHVVKCSAGLYGTRDLFQSLAPCIVPHPEHDALTLRARTHRVTRQREYSPEAIRHVTD